MKIKLVASALILTMLTLFVAPTATQANVQGGKATGAVSLPEGSGATLTNGLFTITRFAVQEGKIVAIGTLTGTLTNTATGQSTQLNQTATVPVQNMQGSCEILNLTLGPINLNLLGLVIQTNTINVRIAAQPGSGNLLGNLLCAVAKLLDSNAAAGAIVNLLNKILGALG